MRAITLLQPQKIVFGTGCIQTLVEDYKKMVLKSSDADFISELILETHANSKICLTKMKKYRAGMITSLFAIFFSIISYVARTMM